MVHRFLAALLLVAVLPLMAQNTTKEIIIGTASRVGPGTVKKFKEVKADTVVLAADPANPVIKSCVDQLTDDEVAPSKAVCMWNSTTIAQNALTDPVACLQLGVALCNSQGTQVAPGGGIIEQGAVDGGDVCFQKCKAGGLYILVEEK